MEAKYHIRKKGKWLSDSGHFFLQKAKQDLKMSKFCIVLGVLFKKQLIQNEGKLCIC